jgi:acyl transferase domain-containing protein
MEKFMSLNRDSVVISGISGRFPRSKNLKEFTENLRNKVDLVDDEETRWPHFNPEIPRRMGKISGLEKFDGSFFSYLDKHSNAMDPQARILLELSYEAILDAGVSPQSLTGSRTGVFIACMATDSKDNFFHFIPTRGGLAMSGYDAEVFIYPIICFIFHAETRSMPFRIEFLMFLVFVVLRSPLTLLVLGRFML